MSAPATRPLSPLTLVLEFARSEDTEDPHAFRFGKQRYLLRDAGGEFQSAELHWDQELIDELAAVRLPGRSAVSVQRLGERLRQFLKAAGWSTWEAEILQAVQAHREVFLTFRSFSTGLKMAGPL